MKAFIAILFFIGAAVAQQQNSELVNNLIKRGETLVESANKQLAEIRAAGQGHLINALENEVALAEALTVDLKIKVNELNQTQEFHHLHVIEEELLHRENRISEELAIIREQSSRPTQNLSHAQLVAQAEALVKKGQDAISKQPNTREARAVDAEIFRIEELLKAMKENPTSPNLRQQEEQLARHEATINQLIQRLDRQRPT